MSTKETSLKAEILWQTVPQEIREAILREVWCTRCRNAVTIMDFVGKEISGDVILEGKCAVCGGRVARQVEIPRLKDRP